jgi:hypothetical protein
MVAGSLPTPTAPLPSTFMRGPEHTHTWLALTPGWLTRDMTACALSWVLQTQSGLTCRAGLFTTPVSAGEGEDFLHEFAAAPPDADVS